MQRYDISSLFDRPRKSPALMPVMKESPAAERAYLAILRAFLKRAASAIRETVLSKYAQERSLTQDVGADDFDTLRGILNALLRGVNEQIRSLLRLEADKHTERFMQNAKQAFGIDLRGIVTKEDLNDYLEQAALRNAGLIRGLTDDLVKNVQTLTINATLAGQSSKELAKEVQKALGVSDSRAKLIARDQMGKLNSELNEIRHKQAGIEKYIWRTSQDERVRKRHQELEGKVYSYGEKTGAEEGLPPGRPIQCRCVAQAIVEF